MNKLRGVCLENAESILVSAKLSLDKNINNVAFHLSKIALEEIGKYHMVWTSNLAVKKEGESEMSLDSEDHQQKLFWAFWGGSLGSEKLSKKTLDGKKDLAKNIHIRSLYYLYTDEHDPLSPKDKIEHSEAEMIYNFAKTTLDYEKAHEGFKSEIPEEDLEDYEWFFKAGKDEQKRKEIWSSKSQDKLIEFGNVKDWIGWLKETYDAHEKEMREIAEKEIARKKPETKEDAEKLKYRVRIKLSTPSHSIRKKAFVKFNEHSNWIKLHRIDTNNLTLELYLTKAIPVDGLWYHTWGIARMFVTALNVSSRGLFWWNVPRDPSKYYEDIWDLEQNAGISVTVGKRLELNWSELRLVLGENDLANTSLLFSYITHHWHDGDIEPFDHYSAGISFLAKNDIHLRFETNSYEFFYKSLKSAASKTEGWEKGSDLESFLRERLDPMFDGNTPKSLTEALKIGEEIVTHHKTSKEVTISDVIGIKMYCDVYFLYLAREHHKTEDANNQHDGKIDPQT